MRRKTPKINLELTPGEAFTLSQELEVAAMVREAMKPGRGNALGKMTREAKAYTKLRDERVQTVRDRIGRQYASYVRGKVHAGTGRQRSTRKKGK